MVDLRVFVFAAVVAFTYGQGGKITTNEKKLIAEAPKDGDVILRILDGDSVSVSGIAQSFRDITTSFATVDDKIKAVMNDVSTLNDSTIESLKNVNGSVSTLAGAFEEFQESSAEDLEEAKGELRKEQKDASDALSGKVDAINELMKSLSPGTPVVMAIDVGHHTFTLMYQRIHNAQDVTLEYKKKSSQTWTTKVFKNAQNGDMLVVDTLDENTDFDVRYRGENGLGSGPWRTAAVKTLDGTHGDAFVVHNIPNLHGKVGGATYTAASVTIDLPYDAVVYAAMSGHYRCSSGWMYAAIQYKDGEIKNNMIQGNDRVYAPAHGYSTTWEQFHTARSSDVLKKGKHTFKVLVRCSSANCYLNGIGFQGFYVKKTADVISQRCMYGRWDMPYARNRELCNLRYTLKKTSLVAATFNGHHRVNRGAAYMVVSYDGDGANQQWNMWNNPAHSYSRSWECFGSARVKQLAKGSRRVSATSNGASGSFNGAGLSNVIIPIDPKYNRKQQFGCKYPTWSVSSNVDGKMVCSVTVDLPFESVVMGEFTGHYNDYGSWCTAVISFDDDGKDFVKMREYDGTSWSEFMVAHGYGDAWENFQGKRMKVLPKGKHSVSLWIAGGSTCSLNGAGMDGMWFPTGRSAN